MKTEKYLPEYAKYVQYHLDMDTNVDDVMDFKTFCAYARLRDDVRAQFNNYPELSNNLSVDERGNLLKLK